MTFPEQAASPRPHFASLDVYRFVAAMGVLAFHFTAYLTPLSQASRINYLQVMVDFFFVLSGFVIMHVYGAKMRSLGDYGRYLQKRLARIYPLHLLTFLLYVGLAGSAALGLVTLDNPARYPGAPSFPTFCCCTLGGRRAC